MNINRQIFKIALPAIVSNITVPLLGLSDTTIAGHLGSEAFLAAIAVGTIMVNVLLWPFSFFRAGTSGMTAQAYGSGNKVAISEMFSNSLVLASFIGTIMIILQIPLAWIILKIVSAEPQIAHLASLYFGIIIWSTPAILGTMSVSGWFLGMQSSFYPMIIAITTNLINIAASVIFVFVFKLGFAGTAMGTCLANWFGLVFALILVRKFNGGKLPFISLNKIFTFKGKGKFFKVNSDIFLRSLCIMAVSLGMTAYGASINSLTIAVNAVMLQFFIFFSYFMDGFAFSAEALAGKCVGSGSLIMLRKTEWTLAFWALGMTVLFTLIYAICQAPICRFITPETDVLAGIEQFKIMLVLLPAVSVAAFIYDGLYIGLTATRLMFAATAVGSITFFTFNIFMPAEHSPYVANTILWISFLSYLFMRSLALAILYPQARRRRFQIKALKFYDMGPKA
ncbi:MAG: MATE family efflux transporter [Prevotella sp.]|nr:MATE family efflux transporter [Prevotella sp.]MCM1074709.1 MATE family efflux transporter [Ruminococcus sp.]